MFLLCESFLINEFSIIENFVYWFLAREIGHWPWSFFQTLFSPDEALIFPWSILSLSLLLSDVSDCWGTLSGGNAVRVKSLDISVPVISSVLGSRALVSAAVPVPCWKTRKTCLCSPISLYSSPFRTDGTQPATFFSAILWLEKSLSWKN